MKNLLLLASLLISANFAEAGVCGKILKSYDSSERETNYFLVDQSDRKPYLLELNPYANLEPLIEYLDEVAQTQEVVYVEEGSSYFENRITLASIKSGRGLCR